MKASALLRGGDLGRHVGSFVRALGRKGLSPNTIASYGAALRELAEFLAERGYPMDLRRIKARHVDEWVTYLLARRKPAIAQNRFRSARRFFNWWAGTDDSFSSPMLGMQAPRRPEYPRVLEKSQRAALLRACRGRAFEDRRDLALIRLFLGTGALRAEIANLWIDRDLDLDRGTVRVSGKGRQVRTMGLDGKTAAALADYLRARRDHPGADLPWLWLGREGRLTDSGVGRALQDRGMRAGVPGLYRLGHGIWVEPAPRRPVANRHGGS